MNTSRIYRFADCVVDPGLRQVHRDGVSVEPQPKALDLLVYLIEHRDRVVDKDELLAELWSGVVVSESALTQAIRKARSLVGDDGTRQAMIRTVSRRGFRFVAELDPDPAQSTAPGFVDDNAAMPSVAVLPFVDMSQERDQEYFCDGMAEEVINELTRNAGLHVASRTSAFAFKNRQTDIRDIGSQLGVASVLEGSVRKDDDKLRVTAQLIDARSGFHLWSERWDRKLPDMFAIQDEIAGSIAAALRQPGSAAPRTPSAITAEELCRRAFAYVHRFGQRSQRFAIELFNQALELDSEFARAWAGFAMSHILLYRYAETTIQHLEAAEQAATRAVELDDGSAEAWTSRGAVASARRDFPSAEAAFEKAIQRGPQLFEAHYHYGRACTELGQYEKAAGLYERAAELQPDDYQALTFAAQAYRSLGREELAHSAMQRQLAAAERALSEDPMDARALSLSAGSLLAVDKVAEARDWVTRSCVLEPNEPYVQYNAACVFVMLGEIDKALDALERVNVSAISNRSWMEHDDNLDPLRDHPRFKALIASSH